MLTRVTDVPPPPVPPTRDTWWQRTERYFQRLQRLPLTMMAASLLAMLGQVIPTLLLFPFADRMIERFEDGDVRFR